MDLRDGRHSQRTLIFAYRGARQRAPENTLTAFRLAAELGADGVHFEVQLCKDGEAVVIHDLAVDKTTDGSGWVKELTLAELQELDAGSWHAPEFSGERIPSLDQVLRELGPRLMLNVELRTTTLSSDGLEGEVVRLVEDTNMGHRVFLSSFNPLALWRVRRLNPHIVIALKYAPDQPLYLRSRWLQPLVRPDALHPRWDMIDEESVARARAQGLGVTPWTCNDPGALARLVGWGVDAIITDRPDLLYGLIRNIPSPR